jgi:hypothetical protein
MADHDERAGRVRPSRRRPGSIYGVRSGGVLSWSGGIAGQRIADLYGTLNEIAETRRTARGLVLNLPDILFDFDKPTL